MVHVCWEERVAGSTQHIEEALRHVEAPLTPLQCAQLGEFLFGALQVSRPAVWVDVVFDYLPGGEVGKGPRLVGRLACGAGPDECGCRQVGDDGGAIVAALQRRVYPWFSPEQLEVRIRESQLVPVPFTAALARQLHHVLTSGRRRVLVPLQLIRQNGRWLSRLNCGCASHRNHLAVPFPSYTPLRRIVLETQAVADWFASLVR